MAKCYADANIRERDNSRATSHNGQNGRRCWLMSLSVNIFWKMSTSSTIVMHIFKRLWSSGTPIKTTYHSHACLSSVLVYSIRDIPLLETSSTTDSISLYLALHVATVGNRVVSSVLVYGFDKLALVDSLERKSCISYLFCRPVTDLMRTEQARKYSLYLYHDDGYKNQQWTLRDSGSLATRAFSDNPCNCWRHSFHWGWAGLKIIPCW